MTNTLSLSQLKEIKGSLLAYHHYLNHTMPLILVGIALVVMFVTAIVIHHRTIEESYKTYHLCRRGNIATWHLPLLCGLCMGVIVSICTFAVMMFGQPNTNLMSADQVGAVHHEHPMRYIDNAIHYKEYELPTAQKELDQNRNSYQRLKHPTKFDKDTEAGYVDGKSVKVEHYKNYINRASHLQVHTANYL